MRFFEQTFRRAFITRTTTEPQATGSGTETSARSSTKLWLLAPDASVPDLAEALLIGVDAFQDDGAGSTSLERARLVRAIAAGLRPHVAHDRVTWRTPAEAPQFRDVSGPLGFTPAVLHARGTSAISLMPPEPVVVGLLTGATAVTIADHPGEVVALVVEGTEAERASWRDVTRPVVVRTRQAPDWLPVDGRTFGMRSRPALDAQERVRSDGPYVTIELDDYTALLTHDVARATPQSILREARYRLRMPGRDDGIEMFCEDAGVIYTYDDTTITLRLAGRGPSRAVGYGPRYGGNIHRGDRVVATIVLSATAGPSFRIEYE